jgi:hypothetical protein
MTNYKSSYTNTIFFVVCMFCLSSVYVVKSASLLNHEIAMQNGAQYVPGQSPYDNIKLKTVKLSKSYSLFY